VEGTRGRHLQVVPMRPFVGGPASPAVFIRLLNLLCLSNPIDLANFVDRQVAPKGSTGPKGPMAKGARPLRGPKQPTGGQTRSKALTGRTRYAVH